MDLDDINDLRGGGRSRGHYSSCLSPQYSRRWNDAYQSVYDPTPIRRYFNATPPPSQQPPRRSVPPPPPRPLRLGSENRKLQHKQHSKRRHTRQKSTRFTSKTSASTETSRSSSTSSADSSTNTTTASLDSSGSTFSTNGSSDYRDSDGTSTTSTSGSSTSSTGSGTSSSEKCVAKRKKVQPHANEFSRVAARPSTAAQDEKIAAAAACKAILDKELELKEKEIRLIRQKRNFAAEVQRRSSMLHRFGSEDDAIRQMQRLVDIEDTTPALEEYLRRTTKALPASGTPTDAGALAFLRSYEGGFPGDGVVQLLNRIAAPPSISSAAAAALAQNGDPVVVEEPVAPKRASSESPGREPSVVSAPTMTEGMEPHRMNPEVEASRERSLPVEGHSLHAPLPTPARCASTHALSGKETAPALAAIYYPTTDRSAATGTSVESASAAVKDKSVEEHSTLVAPAAEKTEEAAESATRNGVKGGHVTSKTRGRHSRSRTFLHKSEAENKAAPTSTGHSQPEQQQQLQLLPPPPSPASHDVAEQQFISVDPLQRYSQGRSTQQPWAMAHLPYHTPSEALTQKGKSGPSEIWYASNSPVPLSHREFKSLLCSEYVSTQAVPLMGGKDADATRAGGVVNQQVSAAPPGSKSGRDAHEPFSGGAAKSATSLKATRAQRGAQPLSKGIGDLNEVVRSSATEESAQGQGDSSDRRLIALSPPPPVSLGGDEGEPVVEFPPPPHMMAGDMPPPGDVGSEGEDSCCGCGCERYSCCKCWSAMFRCLFPCCSGESRAKVAHPAEPNPPLTFQRPS
ncbi:hypothetical protein JKF63_06967 [Porcisia hertigi]|uniref:Uncharacterized protein n=1 Tax=Porcisia hertigi TaxID=2761500 RepID=A0A836IDD4_9TRYP|nr:hypothetical protein JKF63_06967 [Porcisia hertigi]